MPGDILHHRSVTGEDRLSVDNFVLKDKQVLLDLPLKPVLTFGVALISNRQIVWSSEAEEVAVQVGVPGPVPGGVGKVLKNSCHNPKICSPLLQMDPELEVWVAPAASVRLAGVLRVVKDQHVTGGGPGGDDAGGACSGRG